MMILFSFINGRQIGPSGDYRLAQLVKIVTDKKQTPNGFST